MWTIEECIAGGELRAAFWRSEDFANLKRARYVHWVMHRRHWPDGPYLKDCMADLSAELAPPAPLKRRQRRKPAK